MKSIMMSLLLALCLTGCSNYNVGDVSKSYCLDTSTATREALHLMVSSAYPGMSVVDYCAMIGVPLVVAGSVLSDVVDAPPE